MADGGAHSGSKWLKHLPTANGKLISVLKNCANESDVETNKIN
jgi:hypothetical protein